jgi:hypothetical protein
VPKLNAFVKDMVADPDIPQKFKVLLKRTLIDLDTGVINLTKELRDQWNCHEAYAFSRTNRDIPTCDFADAAPASNAKFNVRERTLPYPSNDFVAVEDYSEKHRENSFIFLVHELAHIRFNTFIEKNYQRICARLPAPFTAIFDGKCFFNNQFLDFINEKYAWEWELEVFGFTRQKYFPKSAEQWHSYLLAADPRVRTKSIGEYLIKDYEISLSTVMALAPLRVSEILLGGQQVKDAAQLSLTYRK